MPGSGPGTTWWPDLRTQSHRARRLAPVSSPAVPDAHAGERHRVAHRRGRAVLALDGGAHHALEVAGEVARDLQPPAQDIAARAAFGLHHVAAEQRLLGRADAGVDADRIDEGRALAVAKAPADDLVAPLDDGAGLPQARRPWRQLDGEGGRGRKARGGEDRQAEGDHARTGLLWPQSPERPGPPAGSARRPRPPRSSAEDRGESMDASARSRLPTSVLGRRSPERRGRRDPRARSQAPKIFASR